MKTHWTHNPTIFAALAIALYVVLAYIYALVKPIWCDEWWAMVPSFHLVHDRYMGMGEMFTERGLCSIVDRTHTYWYPPLSFLSMATWFKVFGYGLVSARMHTVMWGIVLLCGILALRRRWDIGTWAILITALDYNFLGSSDARPDIMCAALGIWALSTGSISLLTATVLVHPFGLCYTVCVAIIKKDAKYVIWPFALAMLLWSPYILQAPDIWWQTLLGQVYVHTAGLDYTPGVGVYMGFGNGWRLGLLVVYVGCMALVAWRERTVAIWLLTIGLPAFFLTRSPYYLVHIIPLMAICVATVAKKHTWVRLITIPQLVFAITTLIPFWTWDSVFTLR